MHAVECRQRRNAEKLAAMNQAKNGQPLYAVAVTRRRLGKWRAPEIIHVHADSPAQAKMHATAGEGQLKVIGTGLAIGWFQDEKTGAISG